jgi:hypothetical protein
MRGEPASLYNGLLEPVYFSSHRRPHDRSTIVPSDKPQPDIFTQPANGETAGSYFTDGRWNRGGWSTYPSADELAINAEARPSTPNQDNVRK